MMILVCESISLLDEALLMFDFLVVLRKENTAVMKIKDAVFIQIWKEFSYMQKTLGSIKNYYFFLITFLLTTFIKTGMEALLVSIGCNRNLHIY